MDERKYEVNDLYCELVWKAKLFAEVMEYDLVMTEGIFSFYNSPVCRSFDFDVDPSTFHDDPSSFIMDKFLGRFDNG